MKRAINSEFFTTNKGKKVGVFTGADFCAEHEWGIAQLRRFLGMDDNAIGVEACRIKEAKNVHLQIDGNFAYLVLGRYAADRLEGGWREKEGFQSAKAFAKGKCCNENNLYCEWDEESVLVLVYSQDNIKVLKRIYDAIKNKDGFLGTSRQLPAFNNGGLILVGIWDLSRKQVEKMREEDLDRTQLKEASAATGIEEFLKKTWVGLEIGCRWFSLRPRWVSKNEKQYTKFPVIYWLNPQDQENNRAGWFTVEDLREWAEGRGKVVSKQKA